MTFFKTSKGERHLGRVGVLVYLAGFAPGFVVHRMDPHCWLWVVFVVGLALSNGGKSPPRKLADYGLPEIIGMVVSFAGLGGQAYLLLNT